MSEENERVESDEDTTADGRSQAEDVAEELKEHEDEMEEGEES